MEPPPSLHSPAALALLSTQAILTTRLSFSSTRSCRVATQEGQPVRWSACPWQPIRPWWQPVLGRLWSAWLATQQPRRSRLLEAHGTHHRPSWPGCTGCKQGDRFRLLSVPSLGEWAAWLRPLELSSPPGPSPFPCLGLELVTTVTRSTRRRAKPDYGAPSPSRG